ncbi:MAG: D-aminoacyl-tRNA deacylase [Clostridia bacterium]|nr:D-aminoacyl-tRNA deacylase [Clostridia bacterium]
MRAVIQRVSRASVLVDGETIAKIDRGVAVLLGVGREDHSEDARYLAEKTANLRIFEDPDGKLNLSLLDAGGSALVVSQFTLYGDCRKGRRPGFSESASGPEAVSLYELYCKHLSGFGIAVGRGRFGAQMLVEIHNDGPVTLLLDSKKVF